MHVVNNLLIIYYFTLMVGYGFLIKFAWSFNPKGNDYISEHLRTDWSPAQCVQYLLATTKMNFVYLWAIDAFATFFFTCCAITDAFIVVISTEHNEAWLMHRHAAIKIEAHASLEPDPQPIANGSWEPQREMAKAPSLEDTMMAYEALHGMAPDSSDNKGVPPSQRTEFMSEEEVIKDWLLLIHDVKVKVPKKAASSSGED